jgi:hypothetical protein
LWNREIERLYGRLSEEGKELADYIYEIAEQIDELSDEEERYAFRSIVPELVRLPKEERLLVAEISRLRAQMYFARGEEFLP